jgi:gas vesicle protein
MADEERGACLSTIVISFLAGAAIGSGLALLFAPKTGREMRDQIRDVTEDAVDKIRDYAKDAQEKIKSAYESGKDLVKEKKSILSSAIEAGKEAMDKEKERINEEHKV